MINVLVTGSAGFVGRHVVVRLKANSNIDRIVSYDNYDPLCGGWTKESPDPVVGDVTDYTWLQNIVRIHGITHIVHLAAYARNLTCRDYPLRAWEVNTQGTMNVLEIARREKLKRVVVCSSNIALSDVPTVYRESKRAVESLVALYASLGVSTMALRPSNIYGVGQSRTEYQMCAFCGLDAAFERAGFFSITGNGEQTRDWTHVDDVARAFEVVLFSDVRGDTIDVCTGIQTSMNEVASLLDVPVKYIDPRPGDAKELISDPTGMETTFGFEAIEKIEDRIWDAFPAVAKARGRV